MATRPSSVRMPEETRRVIQEASRRSGRDFSSIVNEMLSEAIKTRRIPGIVFADGPEGRVARVGGTGIEVFEVIRTYRDAGDDWNELRRTFDWLSELQLRAALAYAAAYPEEIEDELRACDRWTPEETWSTYPFTRPPWR